MKTVALVIAHLLLVIWFAQIFGILTLPERDYVPMLVQTNWITKALICYLWYRILALEEKLNELGM